MGRGNSQPIQEKGTAATLIQRDVRDSVFAMVAIHMKGVRATARHHGLAEADVEDVILGEMRRRLDKAVRVAYQNGRRDAMFPRRAA